MFPEQDSVRPVTLHSDLVSVTEQRVNGRVEGVTYGSGLSNLQMSLQRRQPLVLDRWSTSRQGGSDEAPQHLNQDPAGLGQARPGGWVGVWDPDDVGETG